MYMTNYRSESKTWPFVQKMGSSHSLLCFRVPCISKLWAPHVEQRLNGEREDGNMDDTLAFVQESLIVKNRSVVTTLLINSINCVNVCN